MIYKSLSEEWPFECEEVWLRWTTDGVNYREEIVPENKIDAVQCLGIPEWRAIEPPEWMSEEDKQAVLNFRNQTKQSEAQ